MVSINGQLFGGVVVEVDKPKFSDVPKYMSY